MVQLMMDNSLKTTLMAKVTFFQPLNLLGVYQWSDGRRYDG